MKKIVTKQQPQIEISPDEIDIAISDTYRMKFFRNDPKIKLNQDLFYVDQIDDSRRYLLDYEYIDQEVGLFDTYPLEYLQFPFFGQLLLELISRATKTPMASTLRRKSIGPDNLKKNYTKARLEIGFQDQLEKLIYNYVKTYGTTNEFPWFLRRKGLQRRNLIL